MVCYYVTVISKQIAAYELTLPESLLLFFAYIAYSAFRVDAESTLRLNS